MNKAVLVFCDNQGIWWLRFLKKGFRHCFIILETDRELIWIDPLSSGVSIKTIKPMEMSVLIEFYERKGMYVLVHEMKEIETRYPFPIGVFSCVEMIKRLIGLRDLRVQTPWQLYKFINRTKKEYIGKKSLTF